MCLTPKRCSSSTIIKPEVLEGDVLLKQPVGADHDIDGAAAIPSIMSAAPSSSETGSAGRCGWDSGCDALGKGLEMLLGQNRRRHQDRHLFAVQTALNAARSATSVLP